MYFFSDCVGVVSVQEGGEPGAGEEDVACGLDFGEELESGGDVFC